MLSWQVLFFPPIAFELRSRRFGFESFRVPPSFLAFLRLSATTIFSSSYPPLATWPRFGSSARIGLGNAAPRLSRHSHARHQTSTNIKMAVAQVSLVSAVKAAPVRASAVSRRSARAVNVVAKAGVERFEVAKKAAPVALAVGASPPDPIEEDPDRCAVRSEPRGATLARSRTVS